MIQIRLQRRGRKNDPAFRVIVVDSKKKPKTGSYLEMVGSYDPKLDRIELKADRILLWMKNGAQVSDTVHNLLVSQKIIDAKKINVLPKKTVAKVEVPAEAPVAAPVAVAPIETPTEVPVEEIVAEVVAPEIVAESNNSVAEEVVTA